MAASEDEWKLLCVVRGYHVYKLERKKNAYALAGAYIGVVPILETLTVY